jgi:murein DD-endopeptidase / murein LD-carboxypeptidase
MPAEPDQGHRYVDRARALLGVPFRLYGRDEHGLDCVGLIALVFDQMHEAPNGYRLRNTLVLRWEALLDRLFVRRSGRPCPGDIIFCTAGPAQYHLGIWTGHSFIHADAGLGRVVETPGPVAWPIRALWCANPTQENSAWQL